MASVLIHPMAVVDDDCEIGVGTRIWQFAGVIRGASIGRDCTVAGCSIVDGAILGDRVAVAQGAQLHPGTKIGSDVFFGPGAIACNDVWPSVDKDGWGLEPGKHTVVVEDGASIGAGAIILPGVWIGKGAVVAAGARVTRDLAPGCVWMLNAYVAPEKPANWRERRVRWAKI